MDIIKEMEELKKLPPVSSLAEAKKRNLRIDKIILFLKNKK